MYLNEKWVRINRRHEYNILEMMLNYISIRLIKKQRWLIAVHEIAVDVVSAKLSLIFKFNFHSSLWYKYKS